VPLRTPPSELVLFFVRRWEGHLRGQAVNDLHRCLPPRVLALPHRFPAVHPSAYSTSPVQCLELRNLCALRHWQFFFFFFLFKLFLKKTLIEISEIIDVGGGVVRGDSE
jgi:hypothetical protein